MGCASSKQKRCRHCQSPYSPVPRSYSMHVHHPPQNQGESYHVVALTSSTLGSLNQINHFNNKIMDFGDDINHLNHGNGTECIGNNVDGNVRKKKKSNDFTIGLIEAKTWSTMIEEKIPKVVPKTPIRTPPGEPEMINTWELMEGLEDVSPLRSPCHLRSFSFDVVHNPHPARQDSAFEYPKTRFQENGTPSPNPKPMWPQLGDDDFNSKAILSDFDSEAISTFRKSFQELPPDNPFRISPLDNDKQQQQQHQQVVSEADNDLSLDFNGENEVKGCVTDYKCGEDKIVLYFTSLRGVRKTYEDCCHVRVILKGLGVRLDERDVSMHSGFKEELRELLVDGFNGGGLPRVFIGKKYIGGAEEIRRLNEDGQLEKLVECCERVDDGDGVGVGVSCQACGDIRFVPCETCSGSCKIYYEADDQEEEEDEEERGEEVEYGFQRCPDCNENGLIRCPICCY